MLPSQRRTSSLPAGRPDQSVDQGEEPEQAGAGYVFVLVLLRIGAVGIAFGLLLGVLIALGLAVVWHLKS